MDEQFPTGSVPVLVEAKVYGKDASWVRTGIIAGWLPIGKATRNGKLVTSVEEINSKYGRINFCISPKFLYEETGCKWKGENGNMATKIRPTLSSNNKYWIEKHRYYELKHFCLQYPMWKKAYLTLDGMNSHPYDLEVLHQTNVISDPTARCTEARLYYSEKMELVERVAGETDSELSSYILKSITEGISYEAMRMQHNIPCCRVVYYDRYRKFFWLLDKARG